MPNASIFQIHTNNLETVNIKFPSRSSLKKFYFLLWEQVRNETLSQYKNYIDHIEYFAESSRLRCFILLNVSNYIKLLFLEESVEPLCGQLWSSFQPIFKIHIVESKTIRKTETPFKIIQY